MACKGENHIARDCDSYWRWRELDLKEEVKKLRKRKIEELTKKVKELKEMKEKAQVSQTSFGRISTNNGSFSTI